MIRSVPRFVLFALILIVAGTGWFIFGHDKAPAGAGAGAMAMGPMPVTVSPPLTKNIVEWNEYTGQFTAIESVEIRSRVGGYLQSINFTDGQIVKKGDLLFTIDSRPFQAALASAKAQLEQTMAKAELAKRQLDRANNLKDKGFETVSNYDERVNDKQASDAAVTAARAAVRTAELDLEYARLTAPITGRISKHEVSIGNLVTGGTSNGNGTLLTTIVSIDPIHFTFDLSEADYLAYQRAIASGKLSADPSNKTVVYAKLADENDWAHEGHMDFIDNQVDRSAGTIRARAIFPNPTSIISPGQFGRVRIPASEAHDVLMLPDSAILTDQSRKIVMSVADDGSVVPKMVELGSLQNGLRIIRSGVDANDKIIVNGLMRARPGAKVIPQPGTIKDDGTVAADQPPAAPAAPSDSSK